eukprot:6223849-Prymnesium_polylepis.1
MVPPFELAGLAPESHEGGERMRAARDLLSVRNSQSGACDQAHDAASEFSDEAWDNTRRPALSRSDGGDNDQGASEATAGHHRDVLGALWVCYHMVTQSAAGGRPELDPR